MATTAAIVPDHQWSIMTITMRNGAQDALTTTNRHTNTRMHPTKLEPVFVYDPRFWLRFCKRPEYNGHDKIYYFSRSVPSVFC